MVSNHPPAWFPDYGDRYSSRMIHDLGLDPRGLKDQYADYWEQNSSHTLNQSRSLARTIVPSDSRLWRQLLGADGVRYLPRRL